MKIIRLLILFLLISGCSSDRNVLTKTNSTDSFTQASNPDLKKTQNQFLPKVEGRVLQKGIFLYSECKGKKAKKLTPDCLCESDIIYPVISGLGNETAQAELNQTFKKEAEEFPTCEGKQLETKEARYFVSQNRVNSNWLTYEVTFSSPEILAISNTASQDTGGTSGPNGAIEGFIIDVETGKKLSAKDVFGDNIEQVNQVIYEKLIPIGFTDKIKLVDTVLPNQSQ
jgi:hypothetical protein